MEEVGTRSVRHFEQRIWDAEDEERNAEGWGGEEAGEGTVELVDSDSAELRRRRNGMLGSRYRGKGGGGVLLMTGILECSSARSAEM